MVEGSGLAVKGSDLQDSRIEGLVKGTCTSSGLRDEGLGPGRGRGEKRTDFQATKGAVYSRPPACLDPTPVPLPAFSFQLLGFTVQDLLFEGCGVGIEGLEGVRVRGEREGWGIQLRPCETLKTAKLA